MSTHEKMSARKLRRILLPAMALFLALVLTVTAGMLSSAEVLDDFFGRGKRTVTALGFSGGWDTNYYPHLYAGSKESRAAAAEVSKRISDEGIVLLKNDGLLPLRSTTPVSPIGLRYYVPFYGGSGSSAIDMGEDYVITPREGLHEAFDSVNAALEGRLEQAAAAGQTLTDNPGVTAAVPLTGAASAATFILEFDPALYTGMEDTCRGTVGIVFVGRQVGETCDAYPGIYDDGTPHMLALSAAERAAVRFASENCDGVVVVLASSSPMQITELERDPKVGAILWMGGAGCSGYGSLGEILTGAVTPSGRTPDLWPTDFTQAPTFANLDDNSSRFVYNNAYTTLVGNTSPEQYENAPFHEYEEGVYLGYKYYETAYDIGEMADYHNRVSGVLYPFGYGLSYTSFTQKIAAFSELGHTVTLTVRVKNTGSRPGMDVVQVYYTPPYTDFDRDYDIEKPTVNLVAYEKTKLLAPGESEDVSLTFDKEDMVSYCFTRTNPDGTEGCYVLEKGTYAVTLRGNSHDVLDSRSAEVPQTIWYDSAIPRRTEALAQSTSDGVAAPRAATNRFEQLRAYMTDPAVSNVTILTRKDWAGTQPTAPTGADQAASDTVIRWLAESDSTKYEFQSDPRLGNASGSLIYRSARPATRAKNGIVLADLRGKDYNDPLWNMLLDQLDMDNQEAFRYALFTAAYQTGPINSIGKPESVEHDGPQGLTLPDQSGHNWLSGTCGYPSVPIMAATWNQDLMYDFGYMVGQEALLAGINGWYAPGLNLHRSPFGGRAAEYFSEDSQLSGTMGAQIISGAGDAGLYCMVKHLALIDTEGHRNPHTSVWLTEQALREIYLKPFELALKNAVKTIRYIDDEAGTVKTRTMRAGDCIMTADCAVGTYWTATSYELLSEVVRGEWGFQGFIVSDMNLNSNSNRVDMLLRSGCDALMSTSGGSKANAQDFSSPTGIAALRAAVKNVCYTLVNSNLMQGAAPGSIIHYNLSPWRVWLLTSDIIAALLLLGAGVWLWLRGRSEKNHPQNYAE